MNRPGTGEASSRSSRRAVVVAMAAAAAIPLAALLVSGAAHVLDPRERAWLSRGDSAQHLVAWSFFAREPWSWPPAAIERWPAPLGTTVGLADAIPLVALPLKAVAGERAADLQYFGPWAALCLAALGVAAALFLIETGGGALLAALGGGLVALSPVVWDRLSRGHPSLAAHALLVGFFVAWLRYFRTGGGRRPLVAAGAIVVVAAAVHPYLMLMSSVLLLALVVWGVRRFGRATWRGSSPPVAVALAAALGVSWLSGFLGVSPRSLVAGGFGGFEADLLSPLNSAGRSRWIPALFADPAREGFSYLGAGLLALGGLALGMTLAVRFRRPGGTAPAPRLASVPGLRELVATAGALAAFAVVPRVSIGGFPLVDLSWLLSPLEPFFDVVRANGRWIWPLHLLLALGAVASMRRLAVRKVWLAVVLAAGLTLQVADAPAWPWGRTMEEAGPSPLAVRLAAASATDADIRQLAQVPAYLLSGAGLHCGREALSDAWVEPALLAARRGWSFNSGYVARAELRRARAACAASTLEAIAAAPRPDTLYLVSTRQSRALEVARSGFACERLARNDRLCRFAPDGGLGARRARGARRPPGAQGEARLHQAVVPDSKPSE